MSERSFNTKAGLFQRLVRRAACAFKGHVWHPSTYQALNLLPHEVDVECERCGCLAVQDTSPPRRYRCVLTLPDGTTETRIVQTRQAAESLILTACMFHGDVSMQVYDDDDGPNAIVSQSAADDSQKHN